MLDVGCGIGTLIHAIEHSVEGGQVIGVDYNTDHIEFASQRYKKSNLSFINGDATIDLPNNSFEVRSAGLVIVEDQTRWGDIWAECRPEKLPTLHVQT